MKKTFCICILFALGLVSCAPGSGFTLPPDMTLVPGTDIPQQVATYISNALTQTANPSTTPTFYFETATPFMGTEAGSSSFPTSMVPPAIPSSQILYQSSTLGIQFNYPSVWYRQETSGGVFLSSFDPSNPPHKLEWTYETISMQFSFKVFITPPGSFEDWVESARQVAYASQLSITEEERFSIASQPAHRLSLVSGSGGVINQILTVINGQYLEINVEGNYNNNLARAVLNSIQPFTASGLKPAVADTPASGVCGNVPGDPANIILGIDQGNIPLAGRCVAIDPSQRIRLVNQSNRPWVSMFADYSINLPVGGDLLLDQPVGQYLAMGIHFLPIGPELWVKNFSPTPTFTPIPTMPGPLRNYSNTEVGYSLTLPPDWNVDEYGMSNPNKEVLFSPGYAEPFVAYLSISLDFRTLDQIKTFYAQNVPEAFFEETVFNGYSGIRYTYTSGRVEYFIPYQNRLFLIFTDKPNDGNVQQALGSIRFTPSTVTIEVTIADNGGTFNIKDGVRLWLNLDSGYDWSISFGDPTVIGGFDNYYIYGLAPGVSSLTAFGNPKCTALSHPCLMPSIMFSITVVV